MAGGAKTDRKPRGGPQPMPYRRHQGGFFEASNWFPHPSSDGSAVLYLTRLGGGTGHPRALDVALRLMDPEGRNPRTVVKLFGGQGTINVPCWAPDASAFAFVRYRPEGR